MNKNVITKFRLIFFLIGFIKCYAFFFSTSAGYINSPYTYDLLYNNLTQQSSPLNSVYLLEITFDGFLNKKKCLATLINSNGSVYLVTAKYCFTYKNNILNIKKIKEISYVDSNNNRRTIKLGGKYNQFQILMQDNSSQNSVTTESIIVFTIQMSSDPSFIFPFKRNDIKLVDTASIYDILTNGELGSTDERFGVVQLKTTEVEDDIKASTKYFIPEVIKNQDGTMSFKLTTLNYSRFYVTEGHNDVQFDSLFYNDYIKFYNGAKLKFDDFVSSNIGGPLFQCNTTDSTTKLQDTRKFVCKLIAINLGARVIPSLKEKNNKSDPLILFGNVKPVIYDN